MWGDGHALDGVIGAHPLGVHQAPEWRQIDGVWAPMPDYDVRYVLALVGDAARVRQGEPPREIDRWRAAQQRTCEPAFPPAGVDPNRAKIPRATQPLSCGDDACGTG